MRHIGKAGIPALGLGTWQLTGEDCARTVREALALGYRHVDTAQAYENEAEVGRGLREAGVPRDEVFLASKLWFGNTTAEGVARSTGESLRRLGVEHLDLLLVHWPSDEDAPLEETLDAMAEEVEKGRVRHLGVSNFPPSWLGRALAHRPLACLQVEYHPLLAQERLLGMVRGHGMALVAYSPLARGRALEEEAVREIAKAHGCSPARVVLAWLLGQEAVGAIPKASSRAHLEENLAALELELDAEERERISGLARGERVIDPSFAPDWEE